MRDDRPRVTSTAHLARRKRHRDGRDHSQGGEGDRHAPAQRNLAPDDLDRSPGGQMPSPEAKRHEQPDPGRIEPTPRLEWRHRDPALDGAQKYHEHADHRDPSLGTHREPHDRNMECVRRRRRTPEVHRQSAPEKKADARDRARHDQSPPHAAINPRRTRSGSWPGIGNFMRSARASVRIRAIQPTQVARVPTA